MERNEVRYGNIVNYRGQQTIMNQAEFVHFLRFPETYEGIELSEKWLLTFGFENNNGFWSLKNIDILDFKLNKDYVIKFNENPANSGISGRKLIKYVHQIQNVYLDLTGEELTIK